MGVRRMGGGGDAGGSVSQSLVPDCKGGIDPPPPDPSSEITMAFCGPPSAAGFSPASELAGDIKPISRRGATWDLAGSRFSSVPPDV